MCVKRDDVGVGRGEHGTLIVRVEKQLMGLKVQNRLLVGFGMVSGVGHVRGGCHVLLGFRGSVFFGLNSANCVMLLASNGYDSTTNDYRYIDSNGPCI